MDDKELYFPGQDYPDREKWLAKRHTPKGTPASLFYDPEKVVAGTQDGRGGVRQGRFNPGVNDLKRAAKTNPGARRQMLMLRRKVQLQGHVTIDKNLPTKGSA